jgi:putative transposase
VYGFGSLAVEPIHYRILGVHISKHRNIMLVAEIFLKSLIKLYGKHIIYSDGGILIVSRSLQIAGIKQHILHSSFEKSIIERAIEYVKDRTEGFDDYYPCRKSLFCPNHNLN